MADWNSPNDARAKRRRTGGNRVYSILDDLGRSPTAGPALVGQLSGAAQALISTQDPAVVAAVVDRSASVHPRHTHAHAHAAAALPLTLPARRLSLWAGA